jgi:hypothetical protein
MQITASVFMGSMVDFDCGQKRLRFVHFRDDPAKHDGPLCRFRHIRGKCHRTGIKRESGESKPDAFRSSELSLGFVVSGRSLLLGLCAVSAFAMSRAAATRAESCPTAKDEIATD